MRGVVILLLFVVASMCPDAARAAAPSQAKTEQLLRTSQAAIGRVVSDWPLVDRAGRSLRLTDLRDKPLVVSFVYTGCFQVCPTTTQFLAQAVKSAQAALGAGRFRVVTIGFNQPFDTPDALATFARQQGIDLPDWEFVAPRADDVPAILALFGLTVTPTPAGFDHLIQASIVDTRGVVVQQVYGDAFALPMFVDPLKDLLAGQAVQAGTVEGLWLKVKLYCTVYDPSSGRYRVNYALFVEIFAGLTFLGALGWFGVHESRRRR